MLRVIPRLQPTNEIAEPIASVLIDFGVHNKPVPSLSFAPCTSMRAGPAALTSIDGDVRVDGASLALDVPCGPFENRFLGLRNEKGTFALRDGSTIACDFTHWRGSSSSFRFDKSTAGGVTRFGMDLWTWTSSSGKALGWVGALHGARARQTNVSLTDGVTGTSDGLRFDGNYVWYVLGAMKGDAPIVVLDTGGEVPRFDQLGMDFQALEFVLGATMRLDVLIGVGQDGAAVGAVGAHLGFRDSHGTETHSPVPDKFDADCWPPVLFSKIVAKLRDESDRTHIALAGYMDSFTDHLDGAYLKSQVALEAYCKSLLSSQTRMLVRDKKVWAKWVTSVEPHVRSLAADDCEDTLVEKLRIAHHAHTSAMVPDALVALGATPPKEVLDEVKRRNIAAHEFVMTRKRDRDVDEDYSRIAMIRSLLGAVVARSAGYEGPVLGWSRDEWGYRSELSWWPATPTTVPAARYHVKRV